MTHPLLQYDTLDDRKELHTLLAKLPPRRRVRFLADCCARARVLGSGTRPAPGPDLPALAERARWDDAADRKLSQDIYSDLHILNFQYELDLTAALLRLERLVRRPG